MNGSETMFYAVMMASWIVIVLAGCCTPFILRKNVAFGVSVPETEYRNPFFVKLRRVYFIPLLVTGLLLGAASLLSGILAGPAVMTIVNLVAIGVYLILMGVLYLICHFRAKAFKAKQNWTLETVTFASLQVADAHRPVSAWWFLTYPVILAATMAVTFYKYPSLPATVPIHFNAAGNADGFAAKSIGVFLSLPAMQLLMGLLFFGMFLAISRAKTQYAGGNAEEGLKRGARFRKIMANFLLGLGAAIELLFAFIQLGMLGIVAPSVLMVLPFVLIVGILVVLALVMLKVGQSGNRLKKSSGEKPQSAVDDDGNWIGGFLYYNKNDPSLFVEKRFGIGYTLNFGNPVSMIVLLLLIVFIVGAALLPLLLK